MAKFQGIKIRENAMVYTLEIISLADFRHLGLLCGGGPVQKKFFRFAKFFQHVKKLFNF